MWPIPATDYVESQLKCCCFCKKQISNPKHTPKPFNKTLPRIRFRRAWKAARLASVPDDLCFFPLEQLTWKSTFLGMHRSKKIGGKICELAARHLSTLCLRAFPHFDQIHLRKKAPVFQPAVFSAKRLFHCLFSRFWGSGQRAYYKL